MAGFSGLEHDFDGFAVAHLADKNYLGRLPQRRTQRVRKAGSIGVQFPLMDGAAFVVVQELDGIFDGDHVIRLLAIDAVEKDRQGGRFAGTSGAGNQHDSIAKFGHVGEVSGKVERG